MQTITINRKEHKIRACVVDAIQHFQLWAGGKTSTVRGTFETGRGRNRHNDIAVLGSNLFDASAGALSIVFASDAPADFRKRHPRAEKAVIVNKRRFNLVCKKLWG